MALSGMDINPENRVVEESCNGRQCNCLVPAAAFERLTLSQPLRVLMAILSEKVMAQQSLEVYFRFFGL